jgi:hypothetical protein
MDAIARTLRTGRGRLDGFIAEQMLAVGFAEMSVDPGILAENLAPIKDGLERMTDEYDKKPFPHRVVNTDEVGWDMEVGLYRRTGTDSSGKAEEKFFFHHAPGVTWEAEEARSYEAFFAALDNINIAAKKIALSLAAEVDKIHAEMHPEFPSLYYAIEKGAVVTRVLRYLHSTDAYMHLDRSAITPHWWSSHGGLEIVGNDGKRHHVREAAWDKIAVFPGKKFAGLFAGDPEAYKDGYYGYGTLHGVKNPRRTRVLPAGDRYSLVSFVHAKLTREAAEWIRKHADAMEAFEGQHAL